MEQYPQQQNFPQYSPQPVSEPPEAPKEPRKKTNAMREILNFVLFVVLVYLGTLFINAFIFRSFNVEGASMEKTFYTGDRLIVNRIPVTMARIANEAYVPERNQIIVFKNPQYVSGTPQEYIVKRVIAFPGERVIVRDGTITVFNADNPDGFNPDTLVEHGTPGSDVSGLFDGTVPEDTLFVVGDHREGNYSCDSRGCLGYIPFYDVIGPVGIRLWPLNKISTY